MTLRAAQVGDEWQALDGDRVVGVMEQWLKPDGRHSLYFGPCSPEAYPLLAAQVPGTVYTMVDAAEQRTLDVLADYRRRGLAKALIAAAFEPLIGRGATEVVAEADRSNLGSTTLLAQLGGVVTGTDVELIREGSAR
jgi:GNAT superfamily N-acetyltransferase